MTTVALPESPPVETVAELLHRLGEVPPERVRIRPLPATEADLLAADRGDRPLCELVDGVLVEKPMGYLESLLNLFLARRIGDFVEAHDLGIVLGPDAPLRLAPGLVRLPDLSFFSWERLPNRELPPGAFLEMAPDLAVEIVSPGNTPAEMARKVGEYFQAGSRLVWIADPQSRTVTVYTGPEEGRVLTEADVLEGGEVLPGFRLAVREWFGRTGRRRGEA